MRLLFFLFCCYNVSASANMDDKFLQIFESVMGDGSVSEECQDSIELLSDKFELSMDNWAFQMIDATSKIPVGILSYNFGELGQFSQCLSIDAEEGAIKGKYCLGSISLTGSTNETNSSTIMQNELDIENNDLLIFHQRARLVDNISTRMAEGNDIAEIGMSYAICLPSNCSDADASILLENIIGSAKANCQMKEDLSPPLTNGAIASIVVFAFFAFLLVVSTAIDLYYKYYVEKSQPHFAFIAFSTYSNGKKLFHMSSNSTELTCLNGIRFISMLWVLIGHMYSILLISPVTNFKDTLEWMDTLRSMTIISGTLSVDSFFVLSGTLLVYSYFKARHHGVPFNIFKFYIHRYLRLTPALAAAVLFTAFLLKYIANGPNWSNIDSQQDTCQKYWWTTLLYIQNYVNKNNAYCLTQTWYLSVDMQLYILSPLVFIPLWKFPKIGVCLLILEIIAFMIVPFVIAFITEIPALLTNYQARVPISDYLKYYYFKTHTRAATWLIGTFLGYILAKIKFHGTLKNLKIPKIIVLGVWGICMAVGLTCVYGGHDSLNGPDYNKWESSFYLALVRPVWALCVCWVVFACVSGYGGPINWILSLPIYQVLNRFTYSIYLIHYPLLLALAYMSKLGIYYTEFNVAYSFWGMTILSFALSIVWVLAFESPVVVLEKWVFSSLKSKSELRNNKKNAGLSA